MTKVGEEEKEKEEKKEKLAASMPRHFPEEMAEAKSSTTYLLKHLLLSSGMNNFNFFGLRVVESLYRIVKSVSLFVCA